MAKQKTDEKTSKTLQTLQNTGMNENFRELEQKFA